MARIEIGMSKDEVIDILGTPLGISFSKDWDKWEYSSDGAAPFGWDFSWFLIKIIFENGKVVNKILEEIGD